MSNTINRRGFLAGALSAGAVAALSAGTSLLGQAAPGPASLKLAPRSKLVMVGDSITDAGHDPSGNPTPWNPSTGLGQGYVALVDGYLGAVYPERTIRVVNRGHSGDTVLDLASRWQAHVLDAAPDWVSIMIGTNDVWRQFDLPRVSELHVPPEVYERTLDDLVARTAKVTQNIVLMTPYILEPNRGDAMRRRMDEYGAIMKQVSGRHGALFVDTQAAFEPVLRYVHPMALAWDRIHPNMVGHTVLARSFLAAVGALA